MNYLEVREQYRLALCRWIGAENRLKELLGAADSAELEQKMLKARSGQQYKTQIIEFARLGVELDRASDRWDTVQAFQARKTAAITAQVDSDLRRIDC